MPTKKTKTKAPATKRPGKARPPQEPSPRDLIRAPDLTASTTLRFDCELFLQVTHSEYLAHEVLALVRQGEAQMDPIAPGQVGTLLLNGFPYTVLGYYTFVERDAEYEAGPKDCSFHGPFYDFYQAEPGTIQGLVDAAGQDFDKARQQTRKLRANMEKVLVQRQKRGRRRQ